MDINNHVCTVCNKTFSTKYSLKAHTERNKKCINMRGIEIKSDFICKGCNHISMQKSDFQTHLANCTKYLMYLQKDEYDKKDIEYAKLNDKLEEQKEEYEYKLEKQKEEYEQKLKHYEEKLEKQKAEYEVKLEKFENAVIASATESRKTTTITNYNTNSNNTNSNNGQFLNLSKEVIEPILREKLTFADARRGQKGLATMVVNNLLKDEDGQLRYRCKDAARQNFEFTDENGETKKDVHATKLIQALIDSKVEKIAGEVGNKEWKDDMEKFKVHNEKVTEIVTLSKDNSAFRSELTALTS